MKIAVVIKRNAIQGKAVIPKIHASHTWHVCYLQPHLRIPAHSCMVHPPEGHLRRAQVTDKDTGFVAIQIMYNLYLILS